VHLDADPVGQQAQHYADLATAGVEHGVGDQFVDQQRRGLGEALALPARQHALHEPPGGGRALRPGRQFGTCFDRWHVMGGNPGSPRSDEGRHPAMHGQGLRGVGYALSSEEHPPRDLVRYAAGAERAGFRFALISDHFHPWTDRQGQSPFVWSVLGGIAVETERLVVGTGVTCPTVRLHPAIVAQAAATTAAMMPGRFFLGVGSGENLNEHVVGARWPSAGERLEMLEEAVEVIRELWQGGQVTRRGRHYTVDRARLYTLPDAPPPVLVAAGGSQAGELAGRIGDGLIATSPQPAVLDAFRSAGGGGRPMVGQVAVCWAPSEQEARRTAFEWWPTAALKGELTQELPVPAHFEQAAATVTEDDVAQTIVCGPDPERHLDALRTFFDAGFDGVYVHQVGPDQQGLFDFYAREVLPKLG
jgi:G6PDH family F420-dependent oxidoreductase